jgi:hypothetical protein
MLTQTTLKTFILTVATVTVAQSDAATHPFVAPGAGDGRLSNRIYEAHSDVSF